MAIAKSRGVKISPLKVRLLLKSLRQYYRDIDTLLAVLKRLPNKAAFLLHKTIVSAISNAENNHGMDIDDLYIHTIMVDEGPVMKRMMPRARGRGDRIIKRTSHITVEVTTEGEA